MATMPSPTLPNGVMDTFKRKNKVAGFLQDNGIWNTNPDVPTTFQGMVLPVQTKDLVYDPTGTYSNDDMKIYTYENLVNGEEVTAPDNGIYTVMQAQNYKPFAAGLNVYFAKKVGESSE